MSVSDSWHYLTTESARRAGVTEPCKCKGTRYPTKRHGRGRQWRVDNPGQPVRSFKMKTGVGSAEEWDKLVNGDLVKGIVPVDLKVGEITIRQLAEKYMAIRYHTGNTPRQLQSILNLHIYPQFGDCQYRVIDEEMVGGWLMKLRRTRSARKPFSVLSADRVADIYDLFLGIMKLGARKTRLPNPCEDVAYPKPPDQPKIIPWKPAFVVAVLAALPDQDQSIGDLSAYCGMRQGETFGLARADILREEIRVRHQIQRIDGKLRLVRVKNEDPRAVPLPTPVGKRLAAHLLRYPTFTMVCECHGESNELLFHRNGRPLNKDNWNGRVWQPAVAKAKLTPTPRTGQHQLRHFAASQMLFGGASMLEVAEFLGDTERVTARTYAHLVDGSMQRMRSIMNRLSAGVENEQEEVDHG